MLNYRIYAGVSIEGPAEIGMYALIGVPPCGKIEGELQTTIGPGAVIRSHTVVYAGNSIGRDFQTGHGATVREQNTIGDAVSIGTGSVVEHHVTIGDGVRIHSQAFIPEYSVLEELFGSSNVVTQTLSTAFAWVKQALKGAYVRRGAKNGATALSCLGLLS